MQQRCPNCGSPVVPGQRFCGGCGAQLSLSCPQCRITVSPGTRFCPNCGATLGGGPTQQPGWGQQPQMPQQQAGWGQQPQTPQQQAGWGQQPAWAPQAAKSQSSPSRPFLVILLIILLIGLGALVYWQFGDQLMDLFNPSGGNGNGDTVIDTTDPVITFPNEPTIGSTSVSIFWKTDEFASTQVQYGLTSNYDKVEPAAPADDPTGGQSLGVIDHSVVITGLTPDTTYHYRVKSKDKAGNEAVSEDKTLTTVSTEE